MTKNINNSLKILEKSIKEKRPIVVNYGKGYFSDNDVRETSYWDNDKQTYISQTGIWSLKLLYEIARGELENVSIEESKV